MSEAPVIQKVYDLLLWVVPILEKFPRSHRFLLGDRIEVKLLDLQDLLVEAYYSKKKDQLLTSANLKCEQIRMLFRLGKDLGLVAAGKYKYASEQVDEIGRMVGGWLKSLPAR